RAAPAPRAGSRGARDRERLARRDDRGRAAIDRPAPGPQCWRLASDEDLRTRQLAIILAGFVLVVPATLVVFRRLAAPIRRLGATVRATSALVPPEPVPVSRPAEVCDLGNDINGLLRSARDELRGRERAEEVTLASERRYRSLFESSPLPMWIHDAATLG